ncbi:MAG: hypothetical protein J5966_06200 [Lachnospiraceae bacterium]|nr:hypothetical protein [Lachnospiraceae bacterium]
MNKNQDTVLLYEYMDKSSLTIRIKVRLDETVDAKLLTEASREAFGRFPYFSVQLTIDEGQNYAFEPNSRPIAVLPERDRRMVLGSEELNRHLFFITYRDDTVWFSCSHSICGGFGVMFWVKSTLYLYLCKKYGNIGAPKDIKLPGTPVTEGELYFPDASALPTDEPILRYNGGNTNLGIGRMLKYIFNPFAQDKYYYEIRIPAKEFMDYAVSIDGTPNTVFVAMMYKAMTRFLGKKEGKEFISGRLAADYRNDIGANQSYRDFARLLHINYEWDMKD